MGYNSDGVRFLLHSADSGVDFSTTVTLGHQSLRGGSVDLAAALAACRGVDAAREAEAIYDDCDGYVDGVLRYLGAKQVDSIDASDYEGATVVHDLNLQIPLELEDGYSALIDGGTLEHVFDFPTAIRSCMRMVRQGGHLILKVPINNFPGHGFYQFSPALLFQVLSPQFGYRILDAFVMETHHPWPRWYRVVDPAAAGARFQFRSNTRTVMYVLAQRVGPVPTFDPPPNQSGYVTRWEGSLGQASPAISPSPATAPAPASTTSLMSTVRKQVMGTAVRIAPPGFKGSRAYWRLKVWLVWAIPPFSKIRHYTANPRGFERVREPWTTARRSLPRGARPAADARRPRYGRP